MAHPLCLGDSPSRGVIAMNEHHEHFKCMASLDKHSSKPSLDVISGDFPSKEWELD